MSDIPTWALDIAEQLVASYIGDVGLLTGATAAALVRATSDERERIARWHETQAEAIDAALEQIASEGGTIEVSRRSLADLHRGFAAAIRAGAQ